MHLLLLSLVSFFIVTAQSKPNVLLIVVDDLRPNLGVYGYKNAFTPNIDRLAKKSIVFNRAYAQQALCAPSRNSFLTSRRPDSLHLYDFYSYWRDTVGNFTTLPQHFKENGYHTHSVGKIFHPGISSNFTDDEKYSWSETPFHPPTESFKEARVCHNDDGTLGRNLICPIIVKEQPGGTLPDMESQRAALAFLKNRNNSVDHNKPYFLAVGFHKPHVPFKFPVEYLKLHPLENITLPAVRKQPFDLSTIAWNPWTDVRSREDIAKLNISFPYGTLPDDTMRKIIQSYNAATSYTDDLIGEILQNVDDNTIIILTSDHGWALGENGEFSKFSNSEIATRVPLIMHIPKLTKTLQTTDSLVELVDLFPTLVDLTQISTSLPKCPENKTTQLCTEGRSLVPLIVSTIQHKKFEGREAIFHQYPRPGKYPKKHPNSDKPRLKEIRIMGHTMRIDQFSYTEWVEFYPNNFTSNWSTVFDCQLYDHAIDPEETRNLAHNIGMVPLMYTLRQKLMAGWRFIK